MDKPLTGSLESVEAVGRPADPGCGFAAGLDVPALGGASFKARSAVTRGLGIPGKERKQTEEAMSFQALFFALAMQHGDELFPTVPASEDTSLQADCTKL